MGKKIYPTNIRKYCGHIIKYSKSFTAVIRLKSKRVYYRKGKFKTYEKALRYIRKKSKKYNIPIKNMIYDRGSHYECCLTNNKTMLFDKDDIDKVQDNVIYAHRDNGNKDRWYAHTQCKKNGSYTTVHFTNIIMNHDPPNTLMTVDHILPGPQHSLDNRKSNLRLATKCEQSINRTVSKSNTSGIKGVSYNKVRNSWSVHWTMVKNKENHKSFACNKYGSEIAKQMAVDYRKKMESECLMYQVLQKKR